MNVMRQLQCKSHTRESTYGIACSADRPFQSDIHVPDA